MDRVPVLRRAVGYARNDSHCGLNLRRKGIQRAECGEVNLAEGALSPVPAGG